MAALRLFTTTVMLLVAASASAAPVDHWRSIVAEAARRFAVPGSIILAVIRAESGGRTMFNGGPITSRAGAMGLMQLMPTTWATMRATLHLGNDPYDPRDNIMAGTLYLRQLRDRFGYPGMIAAYNAGPGRYAAYLAGQRRLPGETMAYLGAVTGRGSMAPIASNPSPRELVFVLRHDLRASADATTPPKLNDGLFAIRNEQP